MLGDFAHVLTILQDLVNDIHVNGMPTALASTA